MGSVINRKGQRSEQRATTFKLANDLGILEYYGSLIINTKRLQRLSLFLILSLSILIVLPVMAIPYDEREAWCTDKAISIYKSKYKNLKDFKACMRDARRQILQHEREKREWEKGAPERARKRKAEEARRRAEEEKRKAEAERRRAEEYRRRRDEARKKALAIKKQREREESLWKIFEANTETPRIFQE